MKQRITQLVTATVLVTASLNAASAADEKLVELAKDGLSTCMSVFPDIRTIHAGMKDAGWRSEGSTGEFRLYSKNGRRVLAAASTPSYKRAGCMIAISKLTGPQAVDLAKAIVSSIPSAKRTNSAEQDALAEWSATINGIPVRIGAMDVDNFHFMRGAGVIMVAEQ